MLVLTGGWIQKRQSHSDWTIEILVGEKLHGTYHVQKSMLSVRSDYFARLFSNKNLKEHEAQTSRIGLEELAATAFPVMLDFVYSLWEDSQRPITHENVVALHHLGGYFEVRRLCKKASAFLIQTMIPDHLGMCYEHAKLFRDEKARQAVIEKCCSSAESIEENSHLMEVSDVQFWLDVLKQTSRTPDPALSNLVSTFCSTNRDSLDAETFSKLTDASCLPELTPVAAIELLELEHHFGFTNVSTGEPTSLRQRSSETLASCWNNLRASYKNRLNSLKPRVLSDVLVLVMDKTNKNLEVMTNLMPKEIIVSGATPAAVNGTYSRTSTLHERAPRFAKDGIWKGNPVKFEIHIFRNVSVGYYRYISVLNGTRPSRDGVDKDFYFIRESQERWRLPPPKTGWTKSDNDEDDDEIKDGVLTLAYGFEKLQDGEEGWFI